LHRLHGPRAQDSQNQQAALGALATVLHASPDDALPLFIRYADMLGTFKRRLQAIIDRLTTWKGPESNDELPSRAWALYR
jgi:hypothetical protein